MLDISCLCGQVTVTLTQRPEFLHECNCALCRKTGARWGYFHPDQVTTQGDTHGYSRQDKAEPAADIRFCATCGSTTHFRMTRDVAAKFGDTMMGVNLRLADEADLAGVELRYPDGQGWDGVAAFGYVRDPRIIGQADEHGARQAHPV